MKVAFYVEKKELGWSYGRLFQNWAESLSFDVINKISDLKNDYNFIISDDTLSIKISSIMPELTSTIVPYVQTLFGLNMLRSGKKGMKRRLGSFLPLYITSKRYKEAMKSFNIILSNSLGTSSLLHHLYNISANYIVYPGVDSEKFKPVSGKKNQVLIYSSAPYLPEIFDPIDVNATKIFITEAEKLGYEIHSFGRRLPFESNVIQHINVQTDKLIELYSSSKVTFTPQPVELFGLVPIESMFCGTPVISTYYHEAIDIKKNGSVFNLKKPIETFDKINLFNEKDIVHSVERFKLENSSKNLSEVLNEKESKKNKEVL